jgi:protein-S-isoprenylcysteine O-methyltransferase Ste14
MYIVALAVFLAAIEAAKRTRLQRSFIDLPLPDRLITDGPFQWVRHPFCTGYLLGALAGPTGIDHPMMFLIAAPLVAISIYAAVREERVWMSGPRAEEYRELPPPHRDVPAVHRPRLIRYTAARSIVRTGPQYAP